MTSPQALIHNRKRIVAIRDVIENTIKDTVVSPLLYSDDDQVLLNCVGWRGDQTDCGYEDTTDFDNFDRTNSQVITRHWEATTDGTLYSVRIYVSRIDSSDTNQVAVYNGTQLRGTGTIPNGSTGWVVVPVTSYLGRSLDFSTSDDIYYGVSFAVVSALGFNIGIQTSISSTPNLQFIEATPPIDPAILVQAASYEAGFILQYI